MAGFKLVGTHQRLVDTVNAKMVIGPNARLPILDIYRKKKGVERNNILFEFQDFASRGGVGEISDNISPVNQRIIRWQEEGFMELSATIVSYFGAYTHGGEGKLTVSERRFSAGEIISLGNPVYQLYVKSVISDTKPQELQVEVRTQTGAAVPIPYLASGKYVIKTGSSAFGEFSNRGIAITAGTPPRKDFFNAMHTSRTEMSISGYSLVQAVDWVGYQCDYSEMLKAKGKSVADPVATYYLPKILMDAQDGKAPSLFAQHIQGLQFQIVHGIGSLNASDLTSQVSDNRNNQVYTMDGIMTQLRGGDATKLAWFTKDTPSRLYSFFEEMVSSIANSYEVSHNNIRVKIRGGQLLKKAFRKACQWQTSINSSGIQYTQEVGVGAVPKPTDPAAIIPLYFASGTAEFIHDTSFDRNQHTKFYDEMIYDKETQPVTSGTGFAYAVPDERFDTNLPFKLVYAGAEEMDVNRLLVSNVTFGMTGRNNKNGFKKLLEGYKNMTMDFDTINNSSTDADKYEVLSDISLIVKQSSNMVLIDGYQGARRTV